MTTRRRSRLLTIRLAALATLALVSGFLFRPAPAVALAAPVLPTNTDEVQVALHWQASTVLASAGRTPAAASDEVPSDWGAGNPPTHFDPSDAPTEVSATPPLVDPSAARETRAGFDGVSELEQKLSDAGHNLLGYGGPDPSVCAGDGFVLETVQNAARVFDTTGTPLTPTVAIGPLLGDGPEELSTDPLIKGSYAHAHERCLYDAPLRRFMITAQRYSSDGTAAIELAVSRTADPRAGWDVYSLPVSGDGSDGTGSLATCPCSPGLLAIGADRNGIYLAATLFGASGDSEAFRIYAISKSALASRNATSAIAITQARPTDRTLAYPVGPTPAQSPPDATYADADGGTEYFVAGCGPIRSAVFVLALTNTSSLNGPTPSLSLLQTKVTTEATVGEASAVTQKEGERPLAAYVRRQWGPKPPLEFPTDFERCGGAIWADGRLWVTQATEVRTRRGPATVGAAWFQLTPSIVGERLDVGVARQGYVAATGNNVIDSAIAVDQTGHGAIAFELVGPAYFPSAAYVPIDESGTGPITIVGRGQVPFDSFAGYEWFGSSDRTANADDFSTATVGSDGRIWTAVSYQPRTARQLLTSWGTRITAIDPVSGTPLTDTRRTPPPTPLRAGAFGPTVPFFTTHANPAGPASAYPLRVVGTNPTTQPRSTTIPTEVLPLRLTMPDGTTWDATDDARRAAASPLFQAEPFDAGRTQFGDALLRNQFWSTGGSEPDYHVLLTPPTILPTVDITVPAGSGYVATNPNGTHSAVVENRWFEREIHELVNARGISPRTLPIILTHQARTTADKGAHGWWSTRDGGRQTWIYASWIDDPSPLPDAAILSHEVAEWFDDPFTDNVVPAWQSPLPGPANNYGCQRLLETGDPLVGVNTTVAGYHLQDEAMLPWFTRQRPSSALNGAYTLFATFDSPPSSC